MIPENYTFPELGAWVETHCRVEGREGQVCYHGRLTWESDVPAGVKPKDFNGQCDGGGEWRDLLKIKCDKAKP